LAHQQSRPQSKRPHKARNRDRTGTLDRLSFRETPASFWILQAIFADSAYILNLPIVEAPRASDLRERT
jgi:hypothetical protein